MENLEQNIVLKPKQKIFADAILQGKTQDESYLIAGFKSKNNNSARVAASNLLTNINIRKYLSIQKEKLAKKIETETTVSVLKTVTELSRIGYCDPANLFNEDGSLKAIKDIDEDTRRAISSVEVKDEYDKDGNYTGSNTKIRFWDKNKALVTIATYLGLLVEKHQFSGDVTVRQQIDTSNLDSKDLIALSNVLKKAKVLTAQNEQRN